MKTSLPKISVIMPVYNGEQYLHTAMKSIIDQTFRDFEMLVMDDGSTDRTAQILEAYAKKDHRIKIFRQRNKGIVESLNTLSSHARAELIARMDADDVAYPQRFAMQYAYMESHPKTVLLGTTCVVLKNGTEKKGVTDTFREDFINRWFMVFNCPFVHSSVMFRKKAFTECGGYWNGEYPAEDYGLWVRMKKYGRMENLQEILGEYRQNVESVSGANFKKQVKMRNRLNRTNFEDLYGADEIPSLDRIQSALENCDLDRHRRQVFSKLACLTGCLFVEKNQAKRAIPYFRWSFRLSKKRLDSLLNLFLARLKKSVYFSIDGYIKLRTMIPQIRWFKTGKHHEHE